MLPSALSPKCFENLALAELMSCQEIIIVGAGPSGLLLALNLARAGIKLRVLEAATEPDQQPRAMLYGPAAVRELRRSGLLEAMEKRGSRGVSGVSWRAPGDAALIAQLPKPPPVAPGKPIPDGVVNLSLNLVVEILLEAVKAEPNATIEMGHRVLDVGQDDTSAWVTCETQTNKEPLRFEGSYVVGCDGATSTVRTSLFGKDFPGHTWDPWLLAANVRFQDLDSVYKKAQLSDVNFIMHPTDWCLIARIAAPEPLWRVTYGDDGSLPREDVASRERMLKRLQTVLPSMLSSPSQFEIVTSSPYRAHQRCAPQFRVGRILLAADAAHLCNPFGGMGLTNGIVDVGGLSDCLIGIHRGVASEDILDKYDTVRREIYRNIVDKITTANFKRIMSDSEEALKSDPLLVACRQAEHDAEMAGKVAVMMRVSMPNFTRIQRFFLTNSLTTFPGTDTFDARLHTILLYIARSDSDMIQLDNKELFDSMTNVPRKSLTYRTIAMFCLVSISLRWNSP